MKNLKTYLHKGATFYAIFDENDNFIERNADKEKLLNKYPNALISEDIIELKGNTEWKGRCKRKGKGKGKGGNLPLHWRGGNARKLGFNPGYAPSR